MQNVHRFTQSDIFVRASHCVCSCACVRACVTKNPSENAFLAAHSALCITLFFWCQKTTTTTTKNRPNTCMCVCDFLNCGIAMCVYGCRKFRVSKKVFPTFSTHLQKEEEKKAPAFAPRVPGTISKLGGGVVCCIGSVP